MNQQLLDLIPKRYLCPNCGEWHKWPENSHELGYYNEESKNVELICENRIYHGETYVNFNGYCYCNIFPLCRFSQYTRGKIPMADIIETPTEPRVTFAVTLYGDLSEEKARIESCSRCNVRNYCFNGKLKFASNYPQQIPFGFEFDPKEFSEATLSVDNIDSDEPVLYECGVSKEQQSQEEVNNMESTTTTTIWTRLYKHSPEQNLKDVLERVSVYKPTLRWAVPVAAVYFAYKILNSKNSKLNINNIYKEGKENVGIDLENLKNRTALHELVNVGGMIAMLYAANKAINFIVHGKDTGEIGPDDLKEGLEKLESARKNHPSMQSTTEALLPVAVSVIIVYVMTQKPAWFDELKKRATTFAGQSQSTMNTYFRMVKGFIFDKLHLDLESEEDARKMKSFFFLAAIVGIGVFLYGKKILGDKAAKDGEETGLKNENLKDFMSQLLSIMQKMMPTAFFAMATFLVTQNVMNASAIDNFEVIDEE